MSDSILEFYYKDMLELMPGHVYWKDRDGILRGCNNNLAKTLKLASCKDIEGKTDYDISSAKDADAIKKIDTEVMTNGFEQINEETYTLPDGSIAIYLTQRKPIFNNNHEVVGLIGISVDITERKKMEEDLRIAKEKAEAANYIMTEFISNTGHILVTPMSKISGAGTVLLYGFSDKYLELKPYFEEIMEGCADWDKAYSQVIKGTSMSEMELKIETFSINEELQNIVSIMEHTKGAKKIELILNTLKSPEDLIETDRLKFHLIIVELVYNAIKFTEEGKIIITLIKENDWFHIEVRDTGIGIPADKLGYIFKQYTMLSRAQKYGAEFKGVGAGLFLNEQRAKLLNAKISVSSEEGKGSTFTLSIPSKLNKV